MMSTSIFFYYSSISISGSFVPSSHFVNNSFFVRFTGILIGGVYFGKNAFTGRALVAGKIKQYYGNDQSLTKTRRALMNIYLKQLRNLKSKTEQFNELLGN